MTITRLQDDEKGVVASFELWPVYDEKKSKELGRPMFNDVEHCRIRLPANPQTVVCAPAHETWRYQKQMTSWGTEEQVPITYAMRFNKQYLQFKQGGPQGFTGTPLSELPFLTQSRRLELKALNIHTAEALAGLDGQALNMLGPGGRDLKNQATDYIEKASKGVAAGELADELAKRDALIAEMQRKLDSMASSEQTPIVVEESPPRVSNDVNPSTIESFSTFDDETLGVWLTDSGIEVDGRWSRNTMLKKAEEILAQKGKKKAA